LQINKRQLDSEDAFYSVKKYDYCVICATSTPAGTSPNSLALAIDF
jgi:hypothetical protein